MKKGPSNLPTHFGQLVLDFSSKCWNRGLCMAKAALWVAVLLMVTTQVRGYPSIDYNEGDFEVIYRISDVQSVNTGGELPWMILTYSSTKFVIYETGRLDQLADTKTNISGNSLPLYLNPTADDWASYNKSVDDFTMAASGSGFIVYGAETDAHPWPTWFKIGARWPIGGYLGWGIRVFTNSITPPGVPTATAATNVSSSGFTANWTTVSGAVGYLLDVSENASFSTYLTNYHDAGVGNVSNVTLSGLSAGATYYYRVRAYTQTGTNSDYSNTISVTTSPTGGPSAPTATAATHVSGGFTANWTAVSGATGYLFDLSSDPTFNGSYSPRDYPVGNVSSFFVSTEFMGVGTYYYRVRAVNQSGTRSSYSNTITVMRLPNLTLTKPPGWSDYIVVSNVEGTHTDSALLTTQDVINIDIAPINNGVSYLGSAWNAKLYINDEEYFIYPGAALASGAYSARLDYGFILGEGTYVIKVVVDTDNSIVESNEGDNTFEKPITVIRYAPEIGVSRNGVDLVDGDSTPSPDDSTDFGSISPISGVIKRTYTITNSGGAPLNLSGTPKVILGGAHAADFAVAVLPSSPVAANGGITAFQITFDPSVSGLRSATVSIANNDTDENPFNFSIQGTGLNSAPTDISLNPSILAENNAPNATVGTLSTTDPDAADSFTYTLVTGPGSTDNGSFTIVGNALKITASANFEAKSSYSIRVQTNDGKGGTFEEAFAIVITNVNEMPSFTKGANQSHPATTNTAQTIVGWATNIDDSDSSVVQTLTFNVSNNNNALFAVQPTIASNGTLSYRPNGSTGTAIVSVSLTDDNTINGTPALTSAVQTFTIFVAAAPEVAVSGNGANIADGDATPTTADFTDFGSVATTAGTVVRTFTVTNTGTATLNFTGTPKVVVGGTYASDFSTTALPTSPLAVSGSTTFQVTFDPSAPGLRTATLSLDNDDTDENPFNFSIQGNGLSGNKDLSNLVVSGASLSPPFATGTLSYTATVPYSTSSITVTPMTSDSTATVAVNGMAVNSGSASGSISLVAGVNTVTTVVTAQDTTTKTYTVTLVRAGSGNPGPVVTGSLLVGRAYHTMTLLPNGKVLAVGGRNAGAYLASAELYDLTTGTWTSTGSLANARGLHTTTLLASGKVLVTGGRNSGTYLSSAELYDPATGTWSATGTLSAARGSHTATLLPNGKVLAAGGMGSAYLASAELYDPATGNWSATGPLAAVRGNHAVALLPNGNVLVTGGYNFGGSLASSELYNPATGTWAYTGSLSTGRGDLTATLLPNGKVLVVGGVNAGSYPSTSELYDPGTGNWSLAAAFPAGRSEHSATLLTDGRVFVAGGHDASGNLASAMFYNSTLGTWSAADVLNAARNAHDAAQVVAGKVLITGGYNSNYLASSELYYTGTNTVPTDISLSGTSIAENNGPNATVGSLSTTDADLGDNYSYSLVAGTGSSDNASFTIAGNLLKLTPSANFEVKSSYSIRVQTNDGNSGIFAKSITITITNLNEVPSFTKGDDHSISATSTAAQTAPGWATNINDGDSTVAQTLTFSVSNNNSALFTAQPSVSSDGTLRYTPSGNVGSAVVSVSITDDSTINGNAALTSAVQIFTITVVAVPVMVVSGNGVEIKNYDYDPSASDLTDFGKVEVDGTGKVVRTFTITNTGTATLYLNGTPAVTNVGANPLDFTLSQPPASAVGPGGTTTFQVTFDPSVAGYTKVNIHFENNDPEDGNFYFSLLGTGIGTSTGSNPGDVDALDAGIPPISQLEGYETQRSVNAIAVQPDGKVIVAGNFSRVFGMSFSNIARFNVDGTLDATFFPNPNGPIGCVLVQADGKILIGGEFTTLQPNYGPVATRHNLARLHPDGSLDAGFNPSATSSNPNPAVKTMVMQRDGKIVIGGRFQFVGGIGRNNVARVNASGALDLSFDPNANSAVLSTVLQEDGKVLIGGDFTTLQPNGGEADTEHAFLARLNADGTLDAGFDPNPNTGVRCMALQSDGKIVIGGGYHILLSSEEYVVRINADGTRDASFRLLAYQRIFCLAMQADGKLLLGGNFAFLQPNEASAFTRRLSIARMNADGSLDSAFDPNAQWGRGHYDVCSIAGQGDGKILLGGKFSGFAPHGGLGGTGYANREAFARLYNDAAFQTLSVPDTTQVQWQRGGASPEVSGVTFELSMDNGASWSSLGSGVRVGVSANWQLTGLTLPASGQIRARGRTSGGGLMETVSTYPGPELAIEQPLNTDLSDGAGKADFGATGASGSVTKTFTVRNTGTANLTLGAITKDENEPACFTVNAEGMAATLAPGERTTFSVKFQPGTLGAKTAMLHLANNDADEGPFEIALVGRTHALSFEKSSLAQLEDAVTIKVPVRLTSTFGSAFEVPFTVSSESGLNSSGLNSSDYIISASPLKFAATQTVAYISITVKDDRLEELSEPLTLILGTPVAGGAPVAGLTVVSPSVFTFTIVEDDIMPSIAPDLVNQIVAVGDAVSFPSGATGSAPLALVWKKNTTVIAGATTGSYGLASAVLTDGATYSLTATNQRGHVNSTAQLAVVDRSDLILRANAGTSPTMTVSATGNSLTYRWRDPSGNDLPLTGTKYSGVATKTLTVKNAVAGDTGHYTCRVTAPGGFLISGDRYLQVPSQKPIANTPSFPDVVAYNNFSYQLTFDPDPTRAPAKFVCTGLPKGVTCNATTGLISGIPTQTGDFTVVVTLSNSTNPVNTADTVQDTFTVFAYPTGAVGVYAGLLGRDTKANADLGGRIDVTTTTLGGYTGTLRLGSSAYPLKGALLTAPPTGGPTEAHPGVTVNIARKGNLPVVLVLDLDPATNDLTGSVKEQGSATSASIVGWRNVWHTTATPTTNPVVNQLGAHSFKIDPAATGPQGYGYGTIDVKNTGSTTVSGRTADGGVIASTGVLGPDGEVVVYSVLFTNKGSVLGTMGIDSDTNHTINSTLNWQKTLVTTARDYAPFGPLTVTALGGLYTVTKPVLNLPALSTTITDNAQFTFSGAGVPSATNPNMKLRISSTNALSLNPTNPGKINTMVFTATTGAFSGKLTLTDPGVAPRTVAFQGWLVPTQGKGFGYFLMPQLANPLAVPPTTATTLPILSGKVLLEVISP